VTHKEWLDLNPQQKKEASEKMKKWLLAQLQPRLDKKNELIEKYRETLSSDEYEINKSKKVLEKLYPQQMRLSNCIEEIQKNKSPAWMQMNYYKIIGEFSL